MGRTAYYLHYNMMEATYIKQRIEFLESLKLPLLNKRSRAYKDWKQELNRLNHLLNKTSNGKEN
jgi:hypothetical protein